MRFFFSFCILLKELMKFFEWENKFSFGNERFLGNLIDQEGNYICYFLIKFELFYFDKISNVYFESQFDF